MGYLLDGILEMKIGNRTYKAGTGDVVYLTNEIPSQWKNIGESTARMLWVKINR